MTIGFKLNRTKKKVNHKFEIAFNFKNPQAPRHALGPAALGYGGVPSSDLNNIKTNPRKKIPLTLLCSKITQSKKKVQQNIEIAFKFK